MSARRFLKTRLQALGPLLALILASSCASIAKDEPDSFDMLGDFPTREAAGRLRPYQLRASLLYGDLALVSSRASASSNFGLNGVQAGTRLELERWFRGGSKNRKSLGVIGDFQFLYAGRFYQMPGPPVSYGSASLLFGWRAFGFGHTVPWSPEFTLFLGPAFEVFPSLTVSQLFLGGYEYNLAHPAVLGAKVGARLRIPLFSRNVAIETTGYYIRPIQTLGAGENGVLSNDGTSSRGATSLLDVRINQNLVLGAGVYWGWFRLRYTPAGASGPDETTFYTRSFIGSLRFNL